MTAIDALRRLHAHRAWVNAQLRGAAEMLGTVQLHRRFEIGRGSVWSSLVHLYATERNWLEAIEGDQNPPLLGDNAFESLAELEAAWDELERRWRALFDRLSDGDLGRTVAKVSRSSGAGTLYATPLADVLLHVCTHAHYTAAQTVNMLRRLGIPPSELPDSMLITMSRHEHAR